MSFTAKIRSSRVINGEQAVVTATVNHGRKQEPNPQEVMAALQSMSGNQLTPVPGSFVAINQEPTRTTISGVMSLAKHVMDFPGQEAMVQQGFKAMASNMFLDESEQIWTVKEEGGHKVCVKSNTIDNPEELQGLLAKCTTSITAGNDPAYFTSVASAAQAQAAPEAGTLITFVSESTTKFGVVLGSVFESDSADSYTGNVQVYQFGADDAELVQDCQIVAGAQVTWEEPEDLESQAAGNIGKSQKDMLVDYYRKVYGHGKEFFAQWEQRIRKHAYA